MEFYVKVKSYNIIQFGEPVAFVVVKVHPFTMKLKGIYYFKKWTRIRNKKPMGFGRRI